MQPEQQQYQNDQQVQPAAAGEQLPPAQMPAGSLPQPGSAPAPQAPPAPALQGGQAQNPDAVPGFTQTPLSKSQKIRNPNSAQNSLLISELRDGLVVMNDGSFRSVVACKSINFDLMSEREREGVEYSYQSFLNSLYFPVQIFVRSQRVDIGPYLDKLEKMRRSQDNMLLGILMDDYIGFIDALSKETNIMDKQFYIVVPYYITGDVSSAVNNSKNMLTGMLAPQKQMHIKIDENAYKKAKEEMSNRVNTVVNGLFQMGVRSVPLNTKELGELYYNVYNPDTAVREPIGDFENFTATYVTKGEGQSPIPDLYRIG